ncbi:MAG TPA: hypothetical protein VN809_05260, partial [Telmatospirillum sp.]|nr:hypothetical protein [Telmatospirillum sp.]
MPPESLKSFVPEGREGGVLARISWPVLVALVCFVALAAPWLTWRAVDWGQRQAYEQLAAAGRDRLTLYGSALRGELEKSRNIPLVLANDPLLIAFLSASDGAGAGALDRRLQAMNEALGSSAIYVL